MYDNPTVNQFDDQNRPFIGQTKEGATDDSPTFQPSETEQIMRAVRECCESKMPSAVWSIVEQLAALDDAALGQALNGLRLVFKRSISWQLLHRSIKATRKKRNQRRIGECGVSSPDWAEKLRCNANGMPIKGCNLLNAAIALEHAPVFCGALAYNEFSDQELVMKPLPWSKGEALPRQWTDQDTREATVWLQHRGIDVTVSVVSDAVSTVAHRHSFHPVRERLNSLKWDGTPRLDDLLPRYFGAERNPYTQAIGSKWMLSAVARAFEPGCKVDHCLIAVGPQGGGKSTAMQLLALKEEWFTDNIAPLDQKDAAQDIQGKWIIEFSDLARMGQAEAGMLKSFLTRRSDNFRPSYGRHSQDHPRQCVFAATTNLDEFLTDATGGRRFWPFNIGEIDLPALEANREQLWAEAVERYRRGEVWYLNDSGLVEEAMADHITFREPAHLTFPDHVHRLISGDRVERAAHGPKPQAGRDSLFDKTVILFQDII